jgi:hypothetical protein
MSYLLGQIRRWPQAQPQPVSPGMAVLIIGTISIALWYVLIVVGNTIIAFICWCFVLNIFCKTIVLVPNYSVLILYLTDVSG